MRFDYLSIPKLQAPPHKILGVVSLTIVLTILLSLFKPSATVERGDRTSYEVG